MCETVIACILFIVFFIVMYFDEQQAIKERKEWEEWHNKHRYTRPWMDFDDWIDD